MRIGLIDDALIFRKPYKYSEMEKNMIRDDTREPFAAKLIELAPVDCGYASTIVMLS